MQFQSPMATPSQTPEAATKEEKSYAIANPRQPCPERFIEEVGNDIVLGKIGGAVWHFLKGLKNSPRCFQPRLIGASQAARANAPRVGAWFVAWGGLYSLLDCSLVFIRQKEDPWNPIIAGAATAGFLRMRRGLWPASRWTLLGGTVMALIEGSVTVTSRFISEQQQPHVFGGEPMIMVPNDRSPRSSSSWFERWWGGGGGGGGKKEEEKAEVLVTSDWPPPTFEYK